MRGFLDLQELLQFATSNSRRQLRKVAGRQAEILVDNLAGKPDLDV